MERAATASVRPPPDGGGGGGAAGPALHVAGTYAFRDGSVRIREAGPAIGAASLTSELPKSPFTLAFLDGAGTTLAESGLPFSFSIPIHTHGDVGHDGDSENVFACFQVTRAIPEGTARVEMRFRGAAIWSLSALGAAPKLDLLAPKRGDVVAPGAELLVRWSLSDSDGDAPAHTVLYSQDGGATFTPVARSVRGSEFRWSTGAAAGSERAVVKVIASDGFHAVEAASGEFRLGGGSPSAAILAPAGSPKLVDSKPVALSGVARAPGARSVVPSGDDLRRPPEMCQPSATYFYCAIS